VRTTLIGILADGPANDDEFISLCHRIQLERDRAMIRLGQISAFWLLLIPTSVSAQSLDDRAFEEKLAAVTPSERQYQWQRTHDVYAFIHFGPNTFTNREWGDGKENPAVFNPTAMDVRQWAKAMKSAGLTMAVLTAKHHEGFCLWPTRYTEQSVKNSPWKEGKGDLVREFVDAVRAEGLEIGIYLSPADLFQIESPGGYYGDLSEYVDTVIPTDPASFKSDPTKTRPAPTEGFGANVTYACKADAYNRYFLNQLYELLTEYGPITEVWFDGATPKSRGGQKYAYAAWYELIRKLQPKAVIFGKGPDVRWAGNENGLARETEWSVVGLTKPVAEFDWPDMTGRILGDRATLAKAVDLHWYPAEANVSILPGWFYHDDRNMKSADRLMQLYERSVGRNASFILNIPPDKRGLFSDLAVATLAEFGEKRRALYRENRARGASASATSALPQHPASAALDGNYETYWEAPPRGDAMTPVTFEVWLPQPMTFTRVVLQEQIRHGQRVEAFTVEAQSANGEWKNLGSATTIGYKRILVVPETTANRVRVRFDNYRVSPTLAAVELY
jgi:alpha-L-fucosidase